MTTSCACKLVLLHLLLAMLPAHATEQAGSRTVSFEDEGLSISYSLRLEGCLLNLEVFKPGTLNAGVASIGRTCDRPFAEQLSLVSILLDVALAEPDRLSHVRELYWGVPETPEERVALINAELTHPKHTRGSSMSNELALEILRDANVFGPLIEIFKARGFKLELSSLEKAFKTKAKNLSRVGVDMTKLARPVTPNTWVLDTAQAWFRIEQRSRRKAGRAAPVARFFELPYFTPARLF